MSAKELTFFLPKEFSEEPVLSFLVEELGLGTVDISGNFSLEYQFLARRGEGYSILEMEFVEDASAIVEELADWDRPSQEYKDALLCCHSSIILYYRDLNNARDFIKSLSFKLGKQSFACIVDNGEGCLLRLTDIASCLGKDDEWSWEREGFPELPHIAVSEWSGLE